MHKAAATGQLLERGEELARIESVLAEARAGRGAFVVIEGPAGIGKTALLAAARTAAKSGGMRVLRSRGAELERDFAFGVVRQLFEPPLAEASEHERADLLQAAAGLAAGLLGLPGRTPCGRPALVRSQSLICDLARPLLAVREPGCRASALRASQGLTNREIAQTLFVTSRTVEGHLTSIFRKLQVDFAERASRRA
jgi:hypothetical protein